MKGKVLSIRISEKDIASCVELCNSVNIKPIGMGGYITKTLGILLENLRQSLKIMNMSESQARSVLEQTFGSRDVGYNCDLPDNFCDFSLPNQMERRAEQHIDSRQAFNYPIQGMAAELAMEELLQHKRTGTPCKAPQGFIKENPLIHQGGFIPPEQDESIKFDQDLEEEIRLSAMLEGETLIDKLLVTEHRSDDSEVKLINPELAGPVPAKESEDADNS